MLTASDPRLAEILASYGHPPFWYRNPGFPALVLLILEQQVSLSSGAAAFLKLQSRIGEVSPERVLALTDSDLRADGFSRQKIRYIRQLAHAVLERWIDLDALTLLDDQQARRRLLTLVGVGPWTADVYLLACLRRPDVWPVLDRALQLAAAEALGLHHPPDPLALGEMGERWRPHRSTAARLLWHAYLARRGRREVPFPGL